MKESMEILEAQVEKSLTHLRGQKVEIEKGDLAILLGVASFGHDLLKGADHPFISRISVILRKYSVLFGE